MPAGLDTSMNVGAGEPCAVTTNAKRPPTITGRRRAWAHEDVIEILTVALEHVGVTLACRQPQAEVDQAHVVQDFERW